MLTPKLEELILCGKAEYNTTVISMGRGSIEVPDGKTVVITDITYFHFVDARVNEADPNTPDWNGATVHSMSLYSQQKRDVFGIREWLNKTLDGTPTPGILEDRKNVGGHVHFNTFLVHTDKVLIDIVRMPTVQSWTNITTELPPNVQQFNPKRPPLGQGKDPNGVGGISKYQLSATIEIRDYARRPPTAGYNQSKPGWYVPINNSTALNQPTNDADNSGMLQFPIVNIAYVTINSKIGMEIL